jgi:hypothetical protein
MAKSPDVSQQTKEINLRSNIGVASITIGTHVIKSPRLIEINIPDNQGPILTIAPRPTANDHEASSSQGASVPKEKKPRDPKYTQPVWCPPGLTKT